MKRSRGVSLGIVGICLLAASCGRSYSGGGGTKAGGGATTSERGVVRAVPLLYSTPSNAQGVDGLSVDTNSGALSELSGAGFIPQGLAIGANGEYLYAGNEGDGSLSIYKIDQTTGVLTASGSLAAGNPSFLAASPSGQYLFVLGQDTRQLSVYRIDSSSGNLSQVTSTTVSGGTNLPALAVVGLK